MSKAAMGIFACVPKGSLDVRDECSQVMLGWGEVGVD